MNDPKKIGQIIKALREAEGLSQEEYAERLGVSPTTVSLYQSGRNNFTIRTLDKLADILGYELQLNFIKKK